MIAKVREEHSFLHNQIEKGKRPERGVSQRQDELHGTGGDRARLHGGPSSESGP